MSSQHSVSSEMEGDPTEHPPHEGSPEWSMSWTPAHKQLNTPFGRLQSYLFYPSPIADSRHDIFPMLVPFGRPTTEQLERCLQESHSKSITVKDNCIIEPVPGRVIVFMPTQTPAPAGGKLKPIQQLAVACGTEIGDTRDIFQLCSKFGSSSYLGTFDVIHVETLLLNDALQLYPPITTTLRSALADICKDAVDRRFMYSWLGQSTAKVYAIALLRQRSCINKELVAYMQPDLEA